LIKFVNKNELKKMGNYFSKNLVFIISITLIIIILSNLVLNIYSLYYNHNKIEIDFNFIISILSLIVVLYLYDRFGLKGFIKQKELEKTKELYSILTKTKYYELSYNTTKLYNNNYIYLNKIIFDNDKPKIMKRELLDKLYSDLTEIQNHSFFSDDLFSKIPLDNLHHSKFEIFKFSDDTNFVVINDNNYFPSEDFNDKPSLKKTDYRIINKSFFETYNYIIKTTKKYL
jgi:hypothetical protein